MKVGKFRANRQAVIAAGLCLAIITVLLVVILRPPERSVAAFCRELDKQNSSLAKSGKKYSFGPVYSSIEDMHLYAEAYAKLEPVAPPEIQSNVRALRLSAEKVDKDPTQSFSVGLSAIGPSEDLKQWVETHCTDSAK